MIKSMINKPALKLITWYKKILNYSHTRRLSGHHATSMALKLVLSGTLKNARLTGCPLNRAQS